VIFPNPPPPIRSDTVEALLAAARQLVSDEEQRANSLMTRGSGLAGFAGIILALAGAATKSGHGLHGSLRIWIAYLSAAALTSLAMAVIVVVVGVLVPTSGVTIAMTEVEKFPTNEMVRQEKVLVQGSFLRGLVHSLGRERLRNGFRAKALRLGYVCLCVGLLLVTSVGVTLAISGHFYG
jgi:hypothetical protein